MNYKCLFGFHDWQHGVDEVNFSSTFETISIECQVRYCPKCSKKQIRKPARYEWESWNKLTKEEKRNKILTQLRIDD